MCISRRLRRDIFFVVCDRVAVGGGPTAIILFYIIKRRIMYIMYSLLFVRYAHANETIHNIKTRLFGLVQTINRHNIPKAQVLLWRDSVGLVMVLCL